VLFILGDNVCHSFASWFMEGRSACFTELRDPTEIIMNNFIRPYEKSPYDNSQIYIEVWEWESDGSTGTGRVMDMDMDMDMVVLRDKQEDDNGNGDAVVDGDVDVDADADAVTLGVNNGKQIIYLHPKRGEVEEGDGEGQGQDDGEDDGDGEGEGSDEKFIRFHFLLKFIVTVEELKSYQYVMDAKSLPAKDYDEDDDDDDDDVDDGEQQARQHPMMIPNFRSFKSGCEGLRGYGIHKENEIDEGLSFDILVPSSLFDTNTFDTNENEEHDDNDDDVNDTATGRGDDDSKETETVPPSEYEVDVIAGWAIGRVVTLTKSISFRIATSRSGSENGSASASASARKNGTPHHPHSNASTASFDEVKDEDETRTSLEQEL